MSGSVALRGGSDVPLKIKFNIIHSINRLVFKHTCLIHDTNNHRTVATLMRPSNRSRQLEPTYGWLLQRGPVPCRWVAIAMPTPILLSTTQLRLIISAFRSCRIQLTQFGTRWTRNLALPDPHGVYEILGSGITASPRGWSRPGKSQYRWVPEIDCGAAFE